MSNDQLQTDREHLKLLSIFHYVVAGITALMGCIPIIHLTMGIFLVSGKLEQQVKNNPVAANDLKPEFIGYFFIGIVYAFYNGFQ